MNEIHFISKNVTQKDKELFFGPLDGDEVFIEIGEGWSMANIMMEAGIFKSLSQARKNGNTEPIPKGFSHFKRGKKERMKNIWILNIGEWRND